jgi:hypothetical protein
LSGRERENLLGIIRRCVATRPVLTDRIPEIQ